MIGWALTSDFNLALNLDILFWARIKREELTFDDLKRTDYFRFTEIEEYSQNYVSSVGSVNVIGGELSEDKYQIEFTKEDYLKNFAKAYLAQDEEVYEAIRKGIEKVCPDWILHSFTNKQANLYAFSTPTISTEEFKQFFSYKSDGPI
jgi:hypothetical protein